MRLQAFEDFAVEVLVRGRVPEPVRIAGHSTEQTAAVVAALTEFRDLESRGVSSFLRTREKLLSVLSGVEPESVDDVLKAYTSERG